MFCQLCGRCSQATSHIRPQNRLKNLVNNSSDFCRSNEECKSNITRTCINDREPNENLTFGFHSSIPEVCWRMLVVRYSNKSAHIYQVTLSPLFVIFSLPRCWSTHMTYQAPYFAAWDMCCIQFLL